MSLLFKVWTAVETVKPVTSGIVIGLGVATRNLIFALLSLGLKDLFFSEL